MLIEVISWAILQSCVPVTTIDGGPYQTSILNQSCIVVFLYSACLSTFHLYCVIYVDLRDIKNNIEWQSSVISGSWLQLESKIVAFVCNITCVHVTNVSQLWKYLWTMNKVDYNNLILMSFCVGQMILVFQKPKFENIQLWKRLILFCIAIKLMNFQLSKKVPD